MTLPGIHQLWKILLLVVLSSDLSTGRSIYGHSNVMLHDICTQNPYGSRRFFLDEGENGTIIAKNLDFDRIVSLSRSYYFTAPSYMDPNQSNKRICSVELTTCPSCSIQMQFKILNLSSCENSTKSGSCSGCDHIAIKENYYATPLVICGSNRPLLQYHSVGRSLTFSFVFSRNYDYAFLLEYASVVNARLITGKNGDTGVIQSPHFPTIYPQDYSNEVKLHNQDPYASQTGSIQLVFDDYQLGSLSFIEIFDANSTRLRTLAGSLLFRPPIVVINGNELTIRFYANGGRAPGYRATYTFLNDTAEQIEIPATDCGGYVDDFGGVITMVNMSDPGAAKLYDCIWLVKPMSDYQQKSHLLVRMEQLTDLEPGTTLEVRQGLTSQSPLVETLTSDSQMASEYLVPADIGFYIRLRGRLSSEFKMAVAYAAFSYTECYSMKDFVCLNHRCIDTELRCDGFNHCGDNSDEQTACNKGGVSPQDPSWWFTHTPKYYFPKSNEFSDFGATSFVLLAATLGVVVFIASILALLYRMTSHSAVATVRERQARMDFVRSQLVNDNPSEVIENPPSYEAPPDYAEILKQAEAEANASKEAAAFEGGLRVYIPPTPMPSTGKRRREMVRQAQENARDASMTPGGQDAVSLASSRHPSPARSRTSTPARSRASTPQRRVKRNNAVVTPVHQGSVTPASLTEVESERSSPPPPYEYDPSSPFHMTYNSSNFLTVPTTDETPIDDGITDAASEETVNGEMQIVSEEDTIWIEQHGLPSVTTDCGCPGACSCLTSSLGFTDPEAALIKPSGSPNMTKLVDADIKDGKSKGLTERPKKLLKSLPNKFSSFRTADRPMPPLAMLKKYSWNKSM